jgi:hypothetical protein
MVSAQMANPRDAPTPVSWLSCGKIGSAVQLWVMMRAGGKAKINN